MFTIRLKKSTCCQPTQETSSGGARRDPGTSGEKYLGPLRLTESLGVTWRIFKITLSELNTQDVGNRTSRAKGLPCGAVVKNPPAKAGDTGSSPGPGRFHMLWSN